MKLLEIYTKFLLEYNESKIHRIITKYPNLSKDIFNSLLELDPTNNKDFFNWLIQKYIKKELDEYSNKELKLAMLTFNQLKNNPNINFNKNIDLYSVEELINFTKSYTYKSKKDRIEKNKNKAEIQIETLNEEEGKYQINYLILDKIVGTAILSNIDSKQIHLERIGIEDKYQNKGFGQDFLLKIITFIKEKYPEVNKITLLVFSDNNIAISSYKKVGFQISEEMGETYLMIYTI